MKLIKTERFVNFSKDQQDVVQAGINLYKHYLYIHMPKEHSKRNEYAEFAQGKSYDEKQKLFNESLVKEAYATAGVQNSSYSEYSLRKNPMVQWAMFALLEETLTTIIPNTVLDNFYQFSETRIGGYGDNFHFVITNPDLFYVSKVANGIRKSNPQRLYEDDLVVTPIPRSITIQEDFYRMLAGKVDWGFLVTKIAQSIQTDITLQIYNSLFGAYNTYLPSQFKEASFTVDSFVQLCERVQAMNRGAVPSVFGTRTALSRVLPDSDYLKIQLGQEWNTMGYLANFHGYNAYMLDQRIIPNDVNYSFAVDNNTLFIVSMGADKPVKIAFEGPVEIFQNQMNDNADLTVEYTIRERYAAAIATSAKFAIQKVA